ncbi:vomeronasal type-2 receptor 26-like [Pyxicephalus adspersus]|uniref:vomeronasal type-2 receptor 26-like n=1 Tax=Pyxicephalus adspersus TaxID=30357 RepID=UPI003B5A78B0
MSEYIKENLDRGFIRKSSSPADATTGEFSEIWEETRGALKEASVRMKESADKRRRISPKFRPGDKVWLAKVNDLNQSLKPVILNRFVKRPVSAPVAVSDGNVYEAKAILGMKKSRGKTLFLDTPVVKANNKSLSFVLLVSIMLGFLCVFLFLGRPVDIPTSQCSESCLPGYRKVPGSSIYPCCHGCVLCSYGEISNITDSKNCMKCSDYEWPNENRTRCISKQTEFLSFTDDKISVVFIVISLLFFSKTLLVLFIFILYQDTPVVKANNKSLSFVLLVSIMLGFLCVFLFLGRPVDVTCLLRQISFGILFTIAVSSVLAKTIMVCIAFKATKPNSVWRQWIGVKLPICIVLACSSVQVMICVSWLSISPPFQELDTHSYQEKIIVQCNEGSVIGFYTVLGYMGILAAGSFILAFLARTLPDRFNEGKYITFSMLVFCSVWIAMIPAYLSTKGKYTVAVEIFSILISNSGLLYCIFLPKCFIILCRPEMNTKSCLHAKI